MLLSPVKAKKQQRPTTTTLFSQKSKPSKNKKARRKHLTPLHIFTTSNDKLDDAGIGIESVDVITPLTCKDDSNNDSDNSTFKGHNSNKNFNNNNSNDDNVNSHIFGNGYLNNEMYVPSKAQRGVRLVTPIGEETIDPSQIATKESSDVQRFFPIHAPTRAASFKEPSAIQPGQEACACCPSHTGNILQNKEPKLAKIKSEITL